MYEQLEEKLRELFGLVPLPGWKSDLPQIVAALCQEHKIEPSAFERELAGDPAALRRLAGRLSIGETYFFREPGHFEQIARHLDQLQSESGKPALIWSAGCASGEEPYSLAIVLARMAPVAAANARIIASDISREALDKARRGTYRQWSFRSAPQWLIREHFKEVSSQEWQLDKAVRARVEFFEESLQERMNQFREHSIDIILFRNVAIYLSPDALQSIYQRFYHILSPHGLLVQSAGDGRPPEHLFHNRREGEYGIFQHHSNSKDLALQTPVQFPPPEVHTQSPPARPAPKHNSAPIRRASSAAPAVRPNTNSLIQLNTNTNNTNLRALDRALTLGDHGRVEEAIQEISAIPDADISTAQALVARGQLFLAAERYQDALADLRQAVFVQPGHLTARYWLSVALRVLGLHHQASLQLHDLARRLSELPSMHVLQDGTTTADELAAAVNADLRMLQ